MKSPSTLEARCGLTPASGQLRLGADGLEPEILSLQGCSEAPPDPGGAGVRGEDSQRFMCQDSQALRARRLHSLGAPRDVVPSQGKGAAGGVFGKGSCGCGAVAWGAS